MNKLKNTESDTFCMEEYSEKYTIVVWNSLLRQKYKMFTLKQVQK